MAAAIAIATAVAAAEVVVTNLFVTIRETVCVKHNLHVYAGRLADKRVLVSSLK